MLDTAIAHPTPGKNDKRQLLTTVFEQSQDIGVTVL